MFFKTHLAPNITIGPTIASGVILNPNILRENIPLSHMLFLVVHSCPVVFSQYYCAVTVSPRINVHALISENRLF